MALGAVILIALLGTIASLGNWRSGFYWLIFLAAVQDPLRKLIPGAPATILLASTPIILGMAFTLVSRRHWWNIFKRTYPVIDHRLSWFFLACIPPIYLSLTYSQNSWLLTVFGIYAYGLFFVAIILGFYFPFSVDDIRKIMSFYCLVSVVMLSGTFLEYFNLKTHWIVLGTKALEMDWVRYSGNYVVQLIAGFYRSPDIMGWHAATTSMLSFILSTTDRPSRRFFWLGISGIAIVALFFCGRRKMFYMLPVAAIILILIYAKARNSSQIINILSLISIPAMIIFFTGDTLGEESTYVNYYKDNMANTSQQLQGHGFFSLITTFQQSGFFGDGLGVASPGSHNLNVDRPRVWQESGPSRLLVELGVPGFVALLILIFAFVQSAWSQVQFQLKARTPMGGYSAGLLAFFLANIGSLIVSGQILADAFITCFLGFSVGLILSSTRLYNPYYFPTPEPALTPYQF